MIKASTRLDNGQYMLLLGISEGNIARLRAGLPIRFEGAQVGIPELFSVTIIWGRTEQELEQFLRDKGIVTDETIIIDPKTDEKNP